VAEALGQTALEAQKQVLAEVTAAQQVLPVTYFKAFLVAGALVGMLVTAAQAALLIVGVSILVALALVAGAAVGAQAAVLAAV
jgi:hypothetical protein